MNMLILELENQWERSKKMKSFSTFISEDDNEDINYHKKKMDFHSKLAQHYHSKWEKDKDHDDLKKFDHHDEAYRNNKFYYQRKKSAVDPNYNTLSEGVNKDGTLKHADDCKMSFGRKDANCPRCKEMMDGAKPRDGWQKSYYSAKKMNDSNRSKWVAEHDCKKSGCGPVCTAFDW